MIGPTVLIRGEVSGEEDLQIQGRVDGKIVLKGHGVTVGKPGKVKADIHAKSIRVEGEVEGDLFGEQEVIIEASGKVVGNLVAPRVSLENGSHFKGSIDMEHGAKQQAAAPGSGKPVQPGEKPSDPAAKTSEGAAGDSAKAPGYNPTRS